MGDQCEAPSRDRCNRSVVPVWAILAVDRRLPPVKIDAKRPRDPRSRFAV